MIMKLWDIAKTAGATALNIAFPGVGSAVVGMVNAFMPEDKKLPETASGNDLDTALKEMRPEDRARIIDHEIEVEITGIKEGNETLRAMLKADQMSNHTTRPKIAYQAFQVVGFCCIALVSAWVYGVVTDKVAIVKTIEDGSTFVLSVTAPLVTLLWAYFGILKQEHKNRMSTIAGSPPVGVVSSILSAFKKS